ncbi:uncharacterized protein SAPINGB_P000250 [Magnusiomyces paraingens]|uniref:t-SNARE coiled-coil homology domain-containing protein n=1 Tax=Magnusiomyces paraingens TaxID=2606893 RepID=A0A5E8AYF1_9ASCO|nr:uncharacterized protein SAPINGB_P000250 [Saprochaete ingens]VVT43996.1 unnamed protein product [Saprochaete ingens]
MNGRDNRTQLFSSYTPNAYPNSYAQSRLSTPTAGGLSARLPAAYQTRQESPYQSDSVMDSLESQNDVQIEGLSAKVKLLKDLTVKIGDEVRDSNKLLSDLENSFEGARTKLKMTFNRMIIMADRSVTAPPNEMSINYRPTPDELNREEEYDDNVIINSWEASLKEYKRHHAIRSDSEKEQNEQQPEQQPERQVEQHIEQPPTQTEDHDINSELQEPNADIPSPSEPDIQQVEVQPLPEPTPEQTTQQNNAETQIEPPLPMEGMDPELKNLLMSWYWAGYYHGLYVGKNKQ